MADCCSEFAEPSLQLSSEKAAQQAKIDPEIDVRVRGSTVACVPIMTKLLPTPRPMTSCKGLDFEGPTFPVSAERSGRGAVHALEIART